MTEIDLESRLAKWNGAQTADYGAICNDLAQLKLNKVAVKYACALHKFRPVRIAKAVSQHVVLDFLSSITFAAVPDTGKAHYHRRCHCWLVQGAMAEAQQLFQQALAVTEAAQTQAEESSASEDDWESSKLTCLLDCCLAVLGKGLHQQFHVTDGGIAHRLGTKYAAHAAAAKACTSGRKKEESEALSASTAYAAICKCEQAAR